MSIEARIERLMRKLFPAGLIAQWVQTLRYLDGVLARLDPEHKPLSEAELRQMAVDAAASGYTPGEVLSQMLTQIGNNQPDA